MIKAVIISQQGSGTNLLRSFLNSHPDIIFEDELFCLNRKFNQFKDSGKSIPDFLNDFYRRYPDKEIVGFDLKYNQIESGILNYLIGKNIRVIHLLRNAGRTFLRQVNKKNNTFTYNQLKEHCKYVKNQSRKIDRFCDKNNIACLRITYENMTRGRELKRLPLDFEQDLLKKFGVFSLMSPQLTLTDKFINKELKIRY